MSLTFFQPVWTKISSDIWCGSVPRLLSRPKKPVFCHCQSAHVALKQKKRSMGNGGETIKQTGEREDALRCYSCFVPTLTKYTCGPVPVPVFVCVYVCVELVCMTAPLPSVMQHLRESAMEMCAPPQHTNTHTQLRQTNVFSALGPSFGLCLFSASRLSFALFAVCCLSLCPTIQSVVNVTLIEEKRGFFLST